MTGSSESMPPPYSAAPFRVVVGDTGGNDTVPTLEDLIEYTDVAFHPGDGLDSHNDETQPQQQAKTPACRAPCAPPEIRVVEAFEKVNTHLS